MPNIPAIPGMNPGAWVMGGGAGGGSGSGSGKGGKNGQGAGGGNGGDGADGGGKGAGSCGQGSGGGCPNPSHGGAGTAAGDPIDVTTGRVYTIPALDLVLPGPLPLRLTRSYSSFSFDRDIGLGWGWTHSLGWELDVSRRALTLRTPDGRRFQSALLEVDEVEKLPDGALIRRVATGYVVVPSGAPILSFGEEHRRGNRYRPSAMVDRNGNSIRLDYDRSGQLRSLVDSAGRQVRVRRHPGGQIAAFEMAVDPQSGTWKAFRTYAYDEQGDLVEARDGAGNAMRFEYRDHLLVSQHYPSGRCVRWVYDRRKRCTETWLEHPGGIDPALDAELSSVLADGSTVARGSLHCVVEYLDDGEAQVTDSRQVRRVVAGNGGVPALATWNQGAFTKTSDPFGGLTSYADALGNISLWVRDTEGRVLSETNPLGATRSYEYDGDGNCILMVPPDGDALHTTWDDRGNRLSVRDTEGVLVAYEYDRRGLMLSATTGDGAVSRLRYDDQGNRIQVTEPNGGTRHLTYDAAGRMTSMIDERGHTTRYSYDERGQLVVLTFPDGTTTQNWYDADGRLVTTIEPDGARYDLAWGGQDALCEVRKPDGTHMHFRYDREGALLRVINEVGEEHRIVRDSGGRVVSETRFDGRAFHYKYDAMGRLVAITDPNLELTEMVYDGCGRVVERTFGDDTKESFEYDVAGRLVTATSTGAVTRFAYDARGRRIGETTEADGETHTIECVYSSSGTRSQRRASWGETLEVELDSMGQPARLILDGEAMVITRDPCGAELGRALPGGGGVTWQRDARGRSVCTRVQTDRRIDPSTPAWAGARPPGTVWELLTDRDAAGGTRREATLDGTVSELQIDLLRQVLSRTIAGRVTESFAYDAAGRMHDGSRTQQSAPGGALLRSGDEQREYDESGRLVTRRLRRADGKEDVWRYRWSASGQLAQVDRPDGCCVKFACDAFGRRVHKQVLDGDGRELSLVRFLWDGDTLAREIRRRTADGDPVVEERSYTYMPGTPLPVAHRDVTTRDGQRAEEPAVYYVTDDVGWPRALVSRDGTLVRALERDVWGRARLAKDAAPSTALRFGGHYEDEETGLFYNRYRYYDPACGRYISPDPVGLLGGPSLYGYAWNRPYEMYDPNGLVPVINTVTGTAGSFDGSSSSGASGGGGPIHPVVSAAQPPQADGMYPTGRYGEQGRPPGACGEPRAMTNYIEAWEQQNGRGAPGTPGYRPLDPNNGSGSHPERKILCTRQLAGAVTSSG
ncbi:MAG: RHS repeat-associated core domain-containing protein [Polyangiaceae bacterium]